MSSNETCVFCPSSATAFCLCLRSPTFLCPSCISSHYQKLPNLAHSLLPIKAYHCDTEEYRRRSGVFCDRKGKLLENLMEVDKCCEVIKTEIGKVVEKLMCFQDELVTQLTVKKSALEADIHEAARIVELNLDNDSIDRGRRFQSYLQGVGPDELILFRYELALDRLNVDLTGIVKTEFVEVTEKAEIEEVKSADAACPPSPTYPLPSLPPTLPNPPLYHLSETTLSNFNFESKQWGASIHLTKPIQINTGSAYTPIPGGRLFCCGCNNHTDKPEKPISYNIAVSTGAVTPLPSLIVPRNSPGVVYIESLETVLVFGGVHTATGEALRGREGWKRLPDMSGPRALFNPCLYLTFVVLCGKGTPDVDVFDTQRWEMRSKMAALPRNSQAIVATQGEDVVVISDFYVSKLRVSEGGVGVESKESGEMIRCWPSGSPVVVGTELFVTYMNECCVISMMCGTVADRIRVK